MFLHWKVAKLICFILSSPVLQLLRNTRAKPSLTQHKLDISLKKLKQSRFKVNCITLATCLNSQMYLFHQEHQQQNHDKLAELSQK